jgi:hypothetical protein
MSLRSVPVCITAIEDATVDVVLHPGNRILRVPTMACRVLAVLVDPALPAGSTRLAQGCRLARCSSWQLSGVQRPWR